MNVCVFSSAYNSDETYKTAARELGSLIGGRGHTLVWGGGSVGTMGIVADAVQKAEGKVVGVILQHVRHQEYKGADEMIVTDTLAQRKAKMLALADAIVVLPGGLGTLDEITEVLELKKHEMHNKKIVFLNINGFYAGFKSQLERMDREGFLPLPLSELAAYTDTPENAMEYIEGYVKS